LRGGGEGEKGQGGEGGDGGEGKEVEKEGREHHAPYIYVFSGTWQTIVV